MHFQEVQFNSAIQVKTFDIFLYIYMFSFDLITTIHCYYIFAVMIIISLSIIYLRTLTNTDFSCHMTTIRWRTAPAKHEKREWKKTHIIKLQFFKIKFHHRSSLNVILNFCNWTGIKTEIDCKMISWWNF